MSAQEKKPFVVMKFGGTSVSSKESWCTIENLVRASIDAGQRPVIVHSALKDVSNLLEAAITAALAGEEAGAVEEVETRHMTLCEALGLDGPALLAPIFERLRQWLAGIALVGEASGRVRARILAQGELLSTTIGAARLNAKGLETTLFDARDALTSTPSPAGHGQNAWLFARCGGAADPDLQRTFHELPGAAILTQGFIARDRSGDTVLLGRGGSDVSAALFAARLAADALEIWTDVPGMFSTDPNLTASARLLKDLSYDEAHELALMGAKVLHPRALPPARRANIPVLVKCTFDPQSPGTRISARPSDLSARVKAVTLKTGIVLVSMTASAMAGEAGFLANAFAAFAKNGLSIDLVSTSEASVTVSLDAGQDLDADVLARLNADLEPLCRVRFFHNCASVSLVGRGIRTILHKLTPALALFREYPVRLVSQAANDLNFTVVVDEELAPKLARQMHDLMIDVREGDPVFGPPAKAAAPAPRPSAAPKPWWEDRTQDLLAVKPDGEAVYVYNLEVVARRTQELMTLKSVDRIYYAMKANAHPRVLKTVIAQGLGIECVSLAEIDHVLKHNPDLDRGRLLFTPNFAPRREYEQALKMGIRLTIDTLYPLLHWPELFAGAVLNVRVDPARGRGHHRHVQTAGARSKFGICIDDLPTLREAAAKAGATIEVLHAHAGSGILDPEHWRDLGQQLSALAADFADIKAINLGGGLGVPETPEAAALDLRALDSGLDAVRAACPQVGLWLEPGRYIVAQAGVLLASVTQTKTKQGHAYAGLETGMNSLLRPALYGAHHEIVNLSQLGADVDPVPVTLVGPICESADVLGQDRLLPPAQEGDVMLIANAGAYGAVMSSSYNLRAPAREIILD